MDTLPSSHNNKLKGSSQTQLLWKLDIPHYPVVAEFAPLNGKY